MLAPIMGVGILALIVAILTAVTTRPAGAACYRLGAQVFATSSSLSGDLPDDGSWQGRSGVGGGLIAELLFTSDISLSLQPAWIPRGGRQVFEERKQVVGVINYDMDYFSVPAVVRITGEPVGVRGFVTAGLSFSFLADATAQTDSASVDISDGLRKTSVAALFGAGAMFPVGSHFITAEVRYTQGLNDIVDRDSQTGTGLVSPSVKYRDFDLMVAFLFTLGGKQ